VTPDSLPPELGSAPRIVSRTTLKSYKAIDGIPTFRDSEVAHLFEKAKEERLLPLVMYNVDPATPISAFVRMFTIGGGRLLWLVFYDGKLAGWGWLDDITNRTARSHFCLFRWVSRAKLSEEIGRDMFVELFNLKFRNEITLQVIRAEMPAFNKPGLWFLENIGLKAIGEIPNAAFRFSTGKFCPMIYLYATRDMLKRSAPSAEPIVPLGDEG
jgi:hypothetical protein